MNSNQENKKGNMIVVNSFNGNICYTGIDEKDCLEHIPIDGITHVIIKEEEYDDYMEMLLNQFENQCETY